MQEYGVAESTTEEHLPLLQALMDNRSILVKTAARITGCHSRAEDVVQDAFFRLAGMQNLALPLKAQGNYIFRIVRNLAIDSYRKQAMEQKYSGSEDEGMNIATHNDTPESINICQETLNTINTALNQLPPRTQYAFKRYRIYGVQQKDIAKELGVSPTLVNFMIRDALVLCRKTIKTSQD